VDQLPINLRRAAVFIGILFLILVIMDFNNRLDDLNRLQKQDGILQAQATQGMQTHTALEAQATYAASDQAVQDWARTEGGYIQPGDQSIIPVGPTNGAPAQPSQPTPSPTPLPNWQIWWNLFFGNQ
jgi:cell division protein FtsB